MSEHSPPSWVRELWTLLPACSHFLLSGNIYDRYFAVLDGGAAVMEPSQEEPDLLSLPDLVTAVLKAAGFESVTGYRLGDEPQVLLGTDDQRGSVRSHQALADAVETAVTSDSKSAILLLSASRLVRDVSNLSDPEFEFYRRMDRLARASRPVVWDESGKALFKPVVWILDHERNVPNWFGVSNELVRSIVLPLPHSGERQVLAGRLVETLGDAEPEERSAGGEVLAQQTAGLTLVAMERTIAIARHQAIGVNKVEDAARSYRVGVTDNPWRADYLKHRLGAELDALHQESSRGGESQRAGITSTVLGQDHAVGKALDILVRSATGMTAAQSAPSATRPRGVLFFAGPTGVGKTELAKAITRLLFDDERFYIRFDMSEFSSEHAADRLIGAPPGYVGHEAGGELTDAIRQRPFSLVLLDEIEKAHPRILDKFLQVLDDGRLTDGKGETVFFTESLLVFTSNLGIYEESEQVDRDGHRVRSRRPVITRSSRFGGELTYPDLEASISKSIQDYFTLQLGRPELLNRIGVDNIVVFDFISDETAKAIVRLMLRNIMSRVDKEFRVTVEIPDETHQVIESACLTDASLSFGGRGIGSMLETVVINPLARQLFITQTRPDETYRLALVEKDDQWTADLRLA